MLTIFIPIIIFYVLYVIFGIVVILWCLQAVSGSKGVKRRKNTYDHARFTCYFYLTRHRFLLLLLVDDIVECAVEDAFGGLHHILVSSECSSCLGGSRPL